MLFRNEQYATLFAKGKEMGITRRINFVNIPKKLIDKQLKDMNISSDANDDAETIKFKNTQRAQIEADLISFAQKLYPDAVYFGVVNT